MARGDEPRASDPSDGRDGSRSMMGITASRNTSCSRLSRNRPDTRAGMADDLADADHVRDRADADLAGVGAAGGDRKRHPRVLLGFTAAEA